MWSTWAFLQGCPHIHGDPLLIHQAACTCSCVQAVCFLVFIPVENCVPTARGLSLPLVCCYAVCSTEAASALMISGLRRDSPVSAKR